MIAAAVTLDRWTLQEATSADIDVLMTWFPQKEDVLIWGGPTFRYPFTPETFFEDIHWGRMASFALRDPAAEFAAFGQISERLGRIHLARLVVHPAQRARGIGKRLLRMLMIASQPLFDCKEWSLFVLRDNEAALNCYQAMGFTVGEYPEDVPHADVCYYLTRPIQRQQQEGEQHDE